MPGHCVDRETFNTIPVQLRLKAIVYDFDPAVEEEDITEKVVDVDIIDYKTGHIWYSNGFRSTSYKLIPCAEVDNGTS